MAKEAVKKQSRLQVIESEPGTTESPQVLEFPEYQGVDLNTLIRAQYKVSQELEAAKKVLSAIQARYDYLRMVKVPDTMDEQGIKTVTIQGVGRVSLTPDIFAGIIPECKSQAYEWLRDNGHGDLITDTVNGSSLKAMLRELIRNGKPIPVELFRVQGFTRASITKV